MRSSDRCGSNLMSSSGHRIAKVSRSAQERYSVLLTEQD
jgi:hypothetical protein